MPGKRWAAGSRPASPHARRRLSRPSRRALSSRPRRPAPRRSGGIALFTLNRPPARNSLSEALIAALRGSLMHIAADRAVRVVVLAANGPAFSAGHDLKETDGAPRRSRSRPRLFRALDGALRRDDAGDRAPAAAGDRRASRAPRPRPAASSSRPAISRSRAAAAKFATPGVNIGLFCSTPMVALSRNVARKHAMEMLLTGDLIDAEEAQRIGLVNRVVAGRHRARGGAGARAADRVEVGARR